MEKLDQDCRSQSKTEGDTTDASSTSVRCDGGDKWYQDGRQHMTAVDDGDSGMSRSTTTTTSTTPYPQGAEFSYNNNNDPSSNTTQPVIPPESPSRKSIQRQQAIVEAEQMLWNESNVGSSSDIVGSATGSDLGDNQLERGSNSESNIIISAHGDMCIQNVSPMHGDDFQRGQQNNWLFQERCNMRDMGDDIPPNLRDMSDDIRPRDMSDDIPPRDMSDDISPYLRGMSDDILPRDMSDDIPPRDMSDDILPRGTNDDILPRDISDYTLASNMCSDDILPRDMSDEIRDMSDYVPPRDFSDDSQCFVINRTPIDNFNHLKIKASFSPSDTQTRIKSSQFTEQKRFDTTHTFRPENNVSTDRLYQRCSEENGQNAGHFEPSPVVQNTQTLQTSINANQDLPSENQSRDSESPSEQGEEGSITSDLSNLSISFTYSENKPKKPLPEKEAKESIRRMIETLRWWNKLDPDDEETKAVDNEYLEETEALLGVMPWERAEDGDQDGRGFQCSESTNGTLMTDCEYGYEVPGNGMTHNTDGSDSRTAGGMNTSNYPDGKEASYQNITDNIVVKDFCDGISQVRGSVDMSQINESTSADSNRQDVSDGVTVSDGTGGKPQRDFVRCMDTGVQDVSDSKTLESLVKNFFDSRTSEPQQRDLAQHAQNTSQDVSDIRQQSMSGDGHVKDFCDGISVEPRARDFADCVETGSIDSPQRMFPFQRNEQSVHPVQDFADGVPCGGETYSRTTYDGSSSSNTTRVLSRDIDDGLPEDDKVKAGAIPKQGSSKATSGLSKESPREKVNRQDSNMSDKGQRRKREFTNSRGSSSKGSRDNSLYASEDDPLACSGDSGRSQSLFTSSGGSSSLVQLRNAAKEARECKSLELPKTRKTKSSGYGSVSDAQVDDGKDQISPQVDSHQEEITESATPRQIPQSPSIHINGMSVQDYAIGSDKIEEDYSKSLSSDAESVTPRPDKKDEVPQSPSSHVNKMPLPHFAVGSDKIEEDYLKSLSSDADEQQENEEGRDEIDFGRRETAELGLQFIGKDRWNNVSSLSHKVHETSDELDLSKTGASTETLKSSIQPLRTNDEAKLGLHTASLPFQSNHVPHDQRLQSGLNTTPREQDADRIQQSHLAAHIQDEISAGSLERIRDFGRCLETAEQSLHDQSGCSEVKLQEQIVSVVQHQIGGNHDILAPARNSFSESSPDPELQISEPNSNERYELICNLKVENEMLSQQAANQAIQTHYDQLTAEQQSSDRGNQPMQPNQEILYEQQISRPQSSDRAMQPNQVDPDDSAEEGEPERSEEGSIDVGHDKLVTPRRPVIVLQVSAEKEDDETGSSNDQVVHDPSSNPVPTPQSSNAIETATEETGGDDREDAISNQLGLARCTDCGCAGAIKLDAIGEPMPIEWEHTGVEELRFFEYNRQEQEEILIASCRCHDSYCMDKKCMVQIPVQGGIRLVPSIAKQLIKMLEKCLNKKILRNWICKGCFDVLHSLYKHSTSCVEERCDVPFCLWIKERTWVECNGRVLMTELIRDYRKRRSWTCTMTDGIFRLGEHFDLVWMNDNSATITDAMWKTGQINHGWFMDDFGKLNVEYCKFRCRPEDNRARPGGSTGRPDDSKAIGIIIKKAPYNDDIREILPKISIMAEHVVEHFWCQQYNHGEASSGCISAQDFIKVVLCISGNN
ncbi:uncharacterized protein [Amphiura filiformis]|uniref:uncharacterized protein n=1 Tax=Amphiura filiformis TaxID=82378 RepID=UPI003B20F611